LAQRFVDRRTSVLMRRLKENAMLEAEITASGEVLVEGHEAGRLQGFRFTLSPEASGPDAKALRAAALKALSPEFETRAARFADAKDEALVLASDGAVRWRGEVVGKLVAGDSVLKPRVAMLADEHISGPAREKIERRLSLWIAARVEKLLGPLAALENPTDLAGVARGIAFQASEALGVLDRARVAHDMKSLDQESRAKLRALGLRFGAYHIYAPALLKPAPRALATQLYALKHGGPNIAGFESIMQFASSGRTSFPADSEASKALYRAAGFRLCGRRAVRVDILERLADLIRPAIQYRPGVTPGTPPNGAADGDGFVVTGQMTSLAGCAGEDFSAILTSLGYAATKRPGPPITVPLVPPPGAAQQAKPAEATAGAVATAPILPAQPSDDEPFLPGIVQEADAANSLLPAAASETPSVAPAVVETPGHLSASTDIVEVAGGAQLAAATPVMSATDAATAAADAPPVAAEPEVIEVWRQQRSTQPRTRPPAAGHGTPALEGRERRRGQRSARAADQQRPVAAPLSEHPVASEASPPSDRNPRHRETSGADGGSRPRRHDRPRGPRRAEAPQGGRQEAPQQLNPQRLERRVAEKRPPKAIDPDNPFAKLMALKARMEEEGRR
jgi:ATP-dependent RNA helicase SUPV3L1/SUV3